MSEHAVVIAGAGPTGMMLAAELTLAGVDVAVYERRVTRELEGSRAGGLHARTLEVFDQRGIAERFLERGKKMQVAGFGNTPLDISDFPTRHNYGLALWQTEIERVLASWVDELEVPVHRGREVTGLSPEQGGVTVALSGGESVRAQYLVGCDGGRSGVRKAAGIDFPGWDATVSHLIAEVVLAHEPPWGMRHDARGMHGLSKLDDGIHVRVMLTEEKVGSTTEPTLRDLSDRLTEVTIGERVETSVAGRYLSATATDPAIAELEDLGEGRLRIEGGNEGVTSVVITRDGGATESIEVRVVRPKKLARLPNARKWTLAPGELIDFEAAGWSAVSASPEVASVAMIGRRLVITAHREGKAELTALSPARQKKYLTITVRP